MARSVSEAGMLMTETSFRPVDLVRIFSPQAVLGARTITALAMVDPVFTRDLRGTVVHVPRWAEDDGRGEAQPAAPVLGDRRRAGGDVHLGTALHLILPYKRGAVTLYGYAYQWNSFAGFKYFQSVMTAPDKFEPRLAVFFFTGIIFTAFLAWMRTQHVWWPFSPLAFALSGSWSMIVFWCPSSSPGSSKQWSLRYGGMKVYSNLRPFFLGLILGEFSQAVIWATLAAVWRLRAPSFPWP